MKGIRSLCYSILIPVSSVSTYSFILSFILPTASPLLTPSTRASISRRTFTNIHDDVHISSSQRLTSNNNNNEINPGINPSQQDIDELISLLDEAVILHSKQKDNDDDVQLQDITSLVEDLGSVIHYKIHDSSNNNNNNNLPSSSSSSFLPPSTPTLTLPSTTSKEIIKDSLTTISHQHTPTKTTTTTTFNDDDNIRAQLDQAILSIVSNNSNKNGECTSNNEQQLMDQDIIETIILLSNDLHKSMQHGDDGLSETDMISSSATTTTTAQEDTKKIVPTNTDATLESFIRRLNHLKLENENANTSNGQHNHIPNEEGVPHIKTNQRKEQSPAVEQHGVGGGARTSTILIQNSENDDNDGNNDDEKTTSLVEIKPSFIPETSTLTTASSTISLTTTSSTMSTSTTAVTNDSTATSSSSTSTTSSSLINNNAQSTTSETDNSMNNNNSMEEEEEVDIAIVGAGIGGLCAGAILNTLYGKKVGVYESHYLPGGCAHAFDRVAQVTNTEDGSTENINFTFDSGPTIVLGCSTEPYNPLRQVLNAVGLGDEVEWLQYDGWGMIEKPSKDTEKRWRVNLGPDLFENGPLMEYGGEDALKEFQELRKVTKDLVKGAVSIPAMAMRSGDSAIVPLLRYLPALVGLIQQGEEVTQGTFKPFMDGPKFVVKNQWLRDWLDALAFSLSGLPASRTAAAAMAYVLYDMHREGTALDYPRGGLGSVIDALVSGVEQGENGSKVHLRQHVDSIDTNSNGSFISGLTLKKGKKIKAKEGVICNAPVWLLRDLIKNPQAKQKLAGSSIGKKMMENRYSWAPKDDESQRSLIGEREPFETPADLLSKCDTAEMTGSFLHLHLALDATDLDLKSLEAHYTVMDRGLEGEQNDGTQIDGPCGELNMIAVSNPCVLDETLAPDGYIVVHAYGAGNEPYDYWKDLDRNSAEYKQLKEERAQVLWRAVESVIPDVRSRVVMSLIGSPKTHERFLRRPSGTYGAATEDYLKDGSTIYERLVLCGDSIFPGIGVPAVALSGASAANSMVTPTRQWKCLDDLKRKKLI